MDDREDNAVQDLLESLIRKMVAFPEEVHVLPVGSILGATFHVLVDERDVSRLLGTEGLTLRALRTVLRAAGSKCNQEFDIVVKPTLPMTETCDPLGWLQLSAPWPRGRA